MTTYYELIDYLDKMKSLPINEEHINALNSSNIELQGNRYTRFISQINYLVTKRLRTSMDSVIDAICERYISPEELVLELNKIRNEVAYAQKITSTKLVKEANRQNFWKSLIENNNDIFGEIKKYYTEDEFLLVIDGYIIKEK